MTRKILYFLILSVSLLLLACGLAQRQPEPTVTISASPMVSETVTLPYISSTATTTSTPTPEPSPAATPTIIFIEPKARGVDIRIDSWSPDGSWLGYWLSTEEDRATPTYEKALYGRLNFLNAQTGQACEHPELVSNEYLPQIIWQTDGRAVIPTQGKYWGGSPCGTFTSIPAEEIVFPKAPDPSLSPNGSYQARTEVRDSSSSTLQVLTTITKVSTGEVEASVEWELDNGPGELGLGGAWVTDAVFVIPETRGQGPLLIKVGEGVIQIAPELFEVEYGESIINANPDTSNVWLRAFAMAVEDTDTYHILLHGGVHGNGTETRLPPARLYHSETGAVEELSYPYLFDRGFSPDGGWVLLDSRPERNGSESTALWIRPVDPPGSLVQLLAEGTHEHRWSPDRERIAFGWTGRFAALTFPAGTEIGAWNTGSYSNSQLTWSPKGDFLAAAGNIPGQFDDALFVVPVP